MKLFKNCCLFFCFATLSVAAQVRVSGFATDSLTGERLIGVNIVEMGKDNATTTDNNGFFSMQTSQPTIIKASFVGYQPVEIQIDRDSFIVIKLVAGIVLAELEIISYRRQPSNIVSLTTSELHDIPALGGKPDVLKAAQLLPGINPQTEGSSLLSVRGGNPGENLYLLDDIPLIYVNHLGGFMSVFNPEMINGIDIYKGGFPAMYGGKLSSIVNITQREGNIDGLKATLGIGVTDMSFSLEGPTKIKNTSFIITGRKTFTEGLMGAASGLIDANMIIFMYGFHDINAKFSWKPNTRNSLHLSIYQGDDYQIRRTKKDPHMRSGKMNTIWGNWLVAARWNHILNQKIFVNNSLSYTRYRLVENKRFEISDDETFWSRYLSSVQDVSLRSHWRYHASKNLKLEYGIQSSLLTHLPNSTRQSNLPSHPLNEKYGAVETSAYLNNHVVFFNRITANIGARSVFYKIDDYVNFSFEPRLQLDVEFVKNHSLNLNYMNVSQNSHLLFTSGGIMNNEVWTPANRRLPVSVSKQYSVGWSGIFNGGMFYTGLEVYSKQLRNLSNYGEGFATLMGDTDWQSKIITGGKGEAKGIEFMIRKMKGEWTGFASWAWSEATRQYPDLNHGKKYIYEFDRPHTVSLNINKRLNEKWTFSTTWVFMSGLPYTPVIGRHLLDYLGENEYIEALIYDKRNSARMKAYHRLDVGLKYEKITRRNHKAVWTFSIYNVYNRRNSYFYYYATNKYHDFPGFYDGKNHSVSQYQLSFFPIIPTVSYIVKIGHFD